MVRTDADDEPAEFDDEDDQDDADDEGVDRPGAPARSETTPPRRRGRQPGRWPSDLGPGDLEAYRRRFGLSEQRLADHLGVSLPTLRGWTKGGRAPAAERHDELRAKLREEYVAPEAPGAPPRRGRPPRLAPSAPLDAAAPEDAPPAPPAAERAGSTARAIVELAAAYLRTPGGQHLTPSELVALLERIRRTVE
ncbi:MAG: helix-turn-helix domain-containing protein [Planctomycetes bacterium]|nr:helix-turn-helix domain-containing protein [Planctomycetota bacterium]